LDNKDENGNMAAPSISHKRLDERSSRRGSNDAHEEVRNNAADCLTLKNHQHSGKQASVMIEGS